MCLCTSAVGGVLLAPCPSAAVHAAHVRVVAHTCKPAPASAASRLNLSCWRLLQIGYRSALVSPVTYTNVVTGASIGQRNSTSTPYVHFGYWANGCTPTASTSCCVYTDSRGRYDYW